MEKTQDVLRLIERMTADHLAWLMRVHSALMFPDSGKVPPCGPESPMPDLCAAACGCSEQLVPLIKARTAMHAAADRLLAKAAGGTGVEPGEYQAFMALVDVYAREARRAECHFRRALIETDPLTGVHNRQGMMRDLRREWTRALRTGRPCCIAIADLDHFKAVNDTWGHAAGDRVLCQAARFFKGQLRPYDMVYRYGGEEFLFCLPDTDLDTAAHVLDRLRSTMASTQVKLDCGSRLKVTCSIGVAQVSAEHSVQETVAAADRALYAAKDGGRNRVELALSTAGPEMAMAALASFRGAVRH